MTRSERLALHGMVNTTEFGTIKVLRDAQFYEMDLRYICSDYEVLYNGINACADIYESNNPEDTNFYARISYEPIQETLF